MTELADILASRRPPTWTTCRDAECRGRRIEAGKCLAHLAEDARKAFLARLGQGAAALNLQGTTISPELLTKILAAVPKTVDGQPELRYAVFEQALFTGPASFDGVCFTGDASFQEATFAAMARFERAEFGGDSFFNRAVFMKGASFGGTKFVGAAWMHYARFLGAATFFKSRFGDLANFAAARFADHATFGEVEFARDATFDEMIVGQILLLMETSFARPVLIQGIVKQLICYKAKFTGGATIRLGGAVVAFEQTELGSLSMLSSLPGNGRINAIRTIASEIGINDESVATGRPRLVSLRQTDVADLVLSDTDLSRCRFVEAHHLDKLCIEGPRPFATTPRGWRFGRVGGQGLPVWRWTERQTLAEEQYWRHERYRERTGEQGWEPKKLKQHGWLQAEWKMPPWLDEPQIPSPDDLAGLYRSLRKAREDSKDEPGAADFYYGEMEMRRLDTVTTRFTERFIIFVYWLIAGYGLRGSRALGWLLLTAGLSTLLLHQFGFEHHRRPWWLAVVYVGGAITRVVSPPEGMLNGGGQGVRITLGLLGPILIGLAALSVRNRIKR